MDDLPPFQYPILGSGHGNRRFAPPPRRGGPFFQYPILGSGHGNLGGWIGTHRRARLSVPYPRVWSRKPLAPARDTAPPSHPFSTLSLGLVTETPSSMVRAARSSNFQYPILGSGHGNRPGISSTTWPSRTLSVPYPRVWSRKPAALAGLRGLVRDFQYPILGSGHGNPNA